MSRLNLRFDNPPTKWLEKSRNTTVLLRFHRFERKNCNGHRVTDIDFFNERVTTIHRKATCTFQGMPCALFFIWLFPPPSASQLPSRHPPAEGHSEKTHTKREKVVRWERTKGKRKETKEKPLTTFTVPTLLLLLHLFLRCPVRRFRFRSTHSSRMQSQRYFSHPCCLLKSEYTASRTGLYHLTAARLPYRVVQNIFYVSSKIVPWPVSIYCFQSLINSSISTFGAICCSKSFFVACKLHMVNIAATLPKVHQIRSAPS
jgi:hypothetical protein